MTLRFREPRVKSDKHLSFVRGLSCLICHDNTSTEAAHVRFSCLEVGKRQSGKAEKPDDRWAVPLCGKHHRDQHEMRGTDELTGEMVFWLTAGIDPIKVCKMLWAFSGDHEKGERIALSAHIGEHHT
jgi:hypothetical protein